MANPDTPLTFRADFGTSTGPVHGGASGMLYGLSDDGVPSDALIAGARPHTMAQKAPDGLQHPNGDALAIARPFFDAGGGEVLVYMQDIYEKWPYEQLGIEDYLKKVTVMVTKVAARPDADRFVWVPFNEPDWIWYPEWETDSERFFADWAAVYREIRRIIPTALIVGPNEAKYHKNRVTDFMHWAVENDLVPNIISWHELEPASLAEYREHYRDYRELEASLGLPQLPINIDEYGNRRDFSNPAQLVQWLAMFEETKVDADMAYWTFAGNLDDQTSQTTQANAGWWLLKWYADLVGETVAVVPPVIATHSDTHSDTDTLQGIATLSADRAEATVLLGGTLQPVTLQLDNLPRATFGDSVDVTVRRATWTGLQGDALAPAVLSRTRLATDDSVQISLPGDPMGCYQVVVTPVEKDIDPTREQPSQRFEAEASTLVDATIGIQNDDPQKFATSGGKDVGGMAAATSSVSFSADVPVSGPHTLSIYYGTAGIPGVQALWIDGGYHSTLRYSATLNTTYWGRLDVELDLTAGGHEFSVRTSTPDGYLEHSEVSLDRFDLRPSTTGDATAHPARTARLSGAARLRPGTADSPALASLRGGSAEFYVAAGEDGYHDLALDVVAAAGASIALDINGRRVFTGTTPAGESTATARVHLSQGLSVLRVSGETDVSVLRVTRVPSADAATIVVTAADLELAEGAHLAQSPWATGGKYVDGLASGSLTVPGTGRTAGAYNLTVSYGNAAQNSAHIYNTDVITVFASVTERGGTAATFPFRYSHAWDNFWSLVLPLDLSTDSGPLTIRGVNGAPTVERVSLSPLVLSASIG